MDFSWLDTAAGITIGFVLFPLAVGTWRRRRIIGTAELPRIVRCPHCRHTISAFCVECRAGKLAQQ